MMVHPRGVFALCLATTCFVISPVSAQYPVPLAPVAWWNDATDVTVGLWARSGVTPFGRWTGMVSRGFGGFQAATIEETVDFRLQVDNPSVLTDVGLAGLLRGWAMDGTVGAQLRVSRPSVVGQATVETGAQLSWVATRETAYLAPALWDNVGSGEATLFHMRRWASRNLEVGVEFEGGGGLLYQERAPGASGSRYRAIGFGRATAEASIRRRLSFLVVGVRGYAGAFYAQDPPAPQRAIPVQGADPYETLGNPWLRTEGAPLAGGDIFYHAPGHANLRGYRPGTAGRWAGAVNVELEADLLRRETGLLRRTSLVGFWDGGIVDTLAVRSFEGRAFRAIADAGFGLRVWLSVGSLQFPLRVEFPVYLSEPVLAHDRNRTSEFLEFRWLVSVQPTF